MAELAVARVYGSALFQAAKEVGKVEEIESELAELTKIFEREPEFTLFLSAPSISIAEKKKTVRDIFEGRLCKEMVNFLEVLIDKNRARSFKKIASVYSSLVREGEGVIPGVIYSVVPLSAEQLAKFEEDTGRLLRGKVRLRNEIDRGLIGGVKIFADGKLIDASVRSRVARLMEKIVE